MRNHFTEKLAVVTGGSSGIGLELVTELLVCGAQVVVMSRSQAGLNKLHNRFPQHLHWYPGDVTSNADLDGLAEFVKLHGKIDFLVPNAGIAMLAEGVDADVFDQQWAVNGAGALGTFASLRDNFSDKGSVVFIGTFLSRLAFPGLAAYIASKTALISHARTLAVEVAGQGVRVNVVSPGPTATPIWDTLGLSSDNLASVSDAVCQRLMEGKFLEPIAIARAIMFLLSEDACGIFGQEIVVDGGYTLR